MFQYNDASIRDKLRLLLSIGVALMLVIAGSILLINSFLTNRAVVNQEIQALAEVTSLAIVPALMFDDKQDARQTLHTLSANKSIVYAAVIKPGQQHPFAFYERKGKEKLVEKTLEIFTDCQQQKFSFYYLNACKPLVYDGIEFGEILLVISLNGIYQSLIKMIAIAFLGLLIASWLIIIVLDRVSKKLTNPILELLNVSEQISQSGNYEIRASVNSKDEIGRLGLGFNGMLDKIESSHQALHDQNEKLEDNVAQRTQDLTKIKNKALVLADKAQKANKAKSEFLSVMSHEIRTPLNAILGSAEFLKETEVNGEQKEIINIINYSGQSLLSQINDILDFSKIEAGKMEIDKSWFDFYQLLISILASVQQSCKEKSILLVHELDANVPRYLFNDEQKIRQILTNLMNNAMKFTKQGSISLIVEMDDSNEESSILNISVKDTGIGITNEKQSVLFMPFTQEDATTTRKYGGTGLGLAIVKKMMDLLNAKVFLSSVLGTGSEFKLQFPIDYQSKEARASLLDKQKSNQLIGLVEHENNSVLAQQLRMLGYDVEYISEFNLKLFELSLDSIKQYSLLLFAEGCLDQFHIWHQLELASKKNIKVAYCAKEKKCSDLNYGIESRLSEDTKILDNVPVVYLCSDGLKMVEQVDYLINSTLLQADAYDEVLTGQLVLVVEDNPVNLLVLKNSLRSSDLVIHTANDGREAVELYKLHDYSLILMDCQMPVMDGFDASRAIRELEKKSDPNRKIPIIAITANAFKDDKEACFAAGMNDFITKSFKKRKLLEVMSRWLNKRLAMGEISIKTPDYSDLPEKVLDSAIIKELVAMDEHGSNEFIVQMSTTFFNNAEDLMPKIELAFTENRFSDIAKIAHQLKSSSLNVAAIGLSNLFMQLEKNTLLGADQEAKKLWKNIVAEYFQVEKAYEHFLKS